MDFAGLQQNASAVWSMYFSCDRTPRFSSSPSFLGAHATTGIFIAALPLEFSLFTRGRSLLVVIFRAGTLVECQPPQFMCFFPLGKEPEPLVATSIVYGEAHSTFVACEIFNVSLISDNRISTDLKFVHVDES